MNSKILIRVTLLYVLIAFGNYAIAQRDTLDSDTIAKPKLSFRDNHDGAFDVSSFLLEHKGVLPVIIPITEPAVGYGGAAAILYFHQRKKKYDSYVPPDISGVIGLYTANNTWGAGALHMHTFGENRVRTISIFMKPNINYKYYGNNSEILNKYPITVKMDSWLLLQRAQVRLAATQIYLGATYTFLKSDISLGRTGNDIVDAILDRLNKSSKISTIKPMLIFDNRDNIFTPTKGINAELSYTYSAHWIGADDNYGTAHTDFYGYFPIVKKLYSGWRFNGSYMVGDAPFYAYPFVSLRGIPAMRYQSDNVLVGETEWRYNFYKRWSIIGFSGVGKAFQAFDNFDDINWVYNVGTGFRYKLARALGAHMGADFALGNGKDFAFYVVFGSSW